MKYNEWRDELKSNLLSVTEAERRRVLDYYAEAYADRREAGFSEREIIDEFGAPYDAAQRILNESVDEEPVTKTQPTKEKPQDKPATVIREEKHEDTPPPPKPKKRENYGWLFVLLCIIFCVPLFGLIMGMVGITIGFCVAPFALVGSGAVAIGTSIGMIIGGDIAYGCYTLGGGLIAFGLGIIAFPLLYKLVKLMWKLFKMVFGAIKNAFTGKEAV